MKYKKWIFEGIVTTIFIIIIRMLLNYKIADLETIVVVGLALCMTKIMTQEIYEGK